MTVNRLASGEIGDVPDCPIDVVTLDRGDVFRALSSETARRVLATLSEAPGAASTIAAELELSIQTISYHLDKLERAGLIAPVATAYSEKGTEMDIYAVTTDSFVVSLGGQGAPAPASSGRDPSERDGD